MSQTEDLLNSLSVTDISTYSADSSVEPHIVIGSDRIITVPDSLKRIAVQHDHNVETVTFDCPRYWDGLDMSTMKVYINYMLSNRMKGAYVADNVAVDETDTNIMHFTWTISRNVTVTNGSISFLVCIKKVDSEGNEENHWNSELNTELYISKGLETTEVIGEAYPDLITQLLTRMDHLIESDSTILDTSLTESGVAADAGATGVAIGNLDKRVQSIEVSVSNKFYVDDYITDTTVNVAIPINSCIEDAIAAGGEVVFTSGKVYELLTPINITNASSSTNPIKIDFNNAIITSSMKRDTVECLINLYCCSNNGMVTNYMKNLILDASNANYGIKAEKSIRMRINNISIKNGLNSAIRISSGIEIYINNFSLWRTESANTLNEDSYGIFCNATDSHFSNGVIVNYKTACRGAGANYFSYVHPWYYFDNEEIHNKNVMMNGTGFRLCGQSALTACEFDSCNVGVEQSSSEYEDNPENDKSAYKTPITINGCSLIISPMYESISEITDPTLIKLRLSSGSNITVNNLNVSHKHKLDTFFCNKENNEVLYDFSEEDMLNLPKRQQRDVISVGVVTGDCLTVNTDHVKVISDDTTTAPSMIFTYKDNLIGSDKLTPGEKSVNGITITVDSDMTIHFNGTATATVNFWLSGKYGVTNDAILLLKANNSYCIMTPKIPVTKILNEDGSTTEIKTTFGMCTGVTSSSTAVSLYTNEKTQYVTYRPTVDTKITGIYISMPVGTVVNNVTYRPAIYMSEKPKSYSPPSGNVITDYTNGIDVNGITNLVSLEEMTIKCGVEYSDYKDLLDRVAALEATSTNT